MTTTRMTMMMIIIIITMIIIVMMMLETLSCWFRRLPVLSIRQWPCVRTCKVLMPVPPASCIEYL